MVTQDTSLLHRSVRDNIRLRPPRRERRGDRAPRRKRAEAHEFIAALQRSARARATTPTSASAASSCRAASASASRSRARCSRTRRSSARRGDERARLARSRRRSRKPLPADGRQDRRRDRPPAVDHRGHGPAHRPRHGRIVEEGTHAQLLARGGLYARCGSTSAAASSATTTGRGTRAARSGGGIRYFRPAALRSARIHAGLPARAVLDEEVYHLLVDTQMHRAFCPRKRRPAGAASFIVSRNFIP